MKTLVVLGAADGALATYRQARTLGYRSIAVDGREASPGVALADEYLPLSTRDGAGIVAALADRDDLAGVLAPSSDIALGVQRELAVRYGLPCGLTEEMVRASVDKRFLREVCERVGLPAYGWTDDPAKLAELTWPVVVKPADAQSSRGVVRCSDLDAALAAVSVAAGLSYRNAVIVEEELAGIQVTAEAVVQDGSLGFLGLTHRTITDPPLAITTSHFAPAEIAPEQIAADLTAVCAALGYRHGPLTADLVVAPDGTPYLIELGARTGGDPLGRLMLAAYGVDTVAASIAAATGTPVDLTRSAPTPALVRYHAPDRAGILTGIPEPGGPGRPELVMLAVPGDVVEGNRTLASKAGWSLFTGGPRAELLTAAGELDRAFQQLIEPATVRGEVDGTN